MLRLEASSKKAANVQEAHLLQVSDDGRLQLGCLVPRKLSPEPIDDVEQKNLEITATRNAWSRKKHIFQYFYS